MFRCIYLFSNNRKYNCVCTMQLLFVVLLSALQGSLFRSVNWSSHDDNIVAVGMSGITCTLMHKYVQFSRLGICRVPLFC